LYYVFDVLILAGSEVMHKPLSLRRELLASEIMSKLRDLVRESAILDASLPDLITAVKAQGLGCSSTPRTCLPGRSATPGHTLECGGNALLLNHEQTRRPIFSDHAFETTSPRERAVLIREGARRTVRAE
jgi:hypothetical protein